MQPMILYNLAIFHFCYFFKTKFSFSFFFDYSFSTFLFSKAAKYLEQAPSQIFRDGVFMNSYT